MAKRRSNTDDFDDDDAETQREWFNDIRSDIKEDVRDAAKDEKEYRREFGEKHLVGYMIHAGRNCPHARPAHGLLALLEDVAKDPTLLPPYPGCHHESCECDFFPAYYGEVKAGTRIAIKDAPEVATKDIRISKRRPTHSSGPSCLFIVTVLCVMAISVFSITCLILYLALQSAP